MGEQARSNGGLGSFWKLLGATRRTIIFRKHGRPEGSFRRLCRILTVTAYKTVFSEQGIQHRHAINMMPSETASALHGWPGIVVLGIDFQRLKACLTWTAYNRCRTGSQTYPSPVQSSCIQCRSLSALELRERIRHYPIYALSK
jgi:hypothetical protein